MSKFNKDFNVGDIITSVVWPGFHKVVSIEQNHVDALDKQMGRFPDLKIGDQYDFNINHIRIADSNGKKLKGKYEQCSRADECELAKLSINDRIIKLENEAKKKIDTLIAFSKTL